MMAANVIAIFDSHTPYLAFRLNALQKALEERGLAEGLRLQLVLIGAEETSYGWEGHRLQELYSMPLTVLSPSFRGLGMRSFFHPSVLPCLWKWTKILVRARPQLILAGGYDRPESMWAALLGRLWRGKTAVWNDSKFNDSESYGKSIWLEVCKSLVVGRYHYYLVPGRESADYHRFLGGRRKTALTEAWDVVDNAAIARQAADTSQDEAIHQALGVRQDYFFFPARFIPKKNVLGVLEAYAAYLKDRQPDSPRPIVPLVICGQGPQEDAIRQAIRKASLQPHVHLVPWLPYHHIPRACRLSRAVLLPSTHDQWGMIVNEALAAGAPVLVSNRCGSHALVRNHANGFTFDPLDLVHLAFLLQTLAEDDALVAALRRRAAPSVENFSIEQWLQRHFTLFQKAGLLPDAPRDLMARKRVLT